MLIDLRSPEPTSSKAYTNMNSPLFLLRAPWVH